MRVEELVARLLRQDGWNVLVSESHLPRGLFATFMGLVTQDPSDSELRLVYFGKRDFSGEQIAILMPMDHHTPAWYARRQDLIRDHLESLAWDDWAWILDYWWESFLEYREYLWAHRDEDKELVTWFLKLEHQRAKRVLYYLAENFWRHASGWPDLLAWRGNSLQFFEVKSPNDRLSEDQIRWLTANEDRLGLDVSLVEVRSQQ